MVGKNGNRVIERQRQLIAEFSSLATWEDRYCELIRRGKALAPLADNLRTEAHKVRGCQAQVWLHARLVSGGNVELCADSDAMIVKGLLAILLETYSSASPEEILAAPTDFLKELGFAGHLSPSRANGLYAMLKQILYYAQAFKLLKESSGQG